MTTTTQPTLSCLDDINPEGFKSITDVFHQACKRYADMPAFTSIGYTLSYRGLEQRSAHFAAYLQQLGLQPGDRIAVQLPNVTQYPVVVFGALRAGLIVVNTNPLYTSTEMRHQFRDSGAKALVILSNCANRAAEILAETNIETVIVTHLADMHKPVKRIILNSIIRYVKRMVPEYRLPKAISFTQALREGEKAVFTEYYAESSDIAVLQYTGGTTGVAKGAMLTHANLVANLLQVRHHFADAVQEGKELFVGPLPLYHIYAFTLHCMSVQSCWFSGIGLFPTSRYRIRGDGLNPRRSRTLARSDRYDHHRRLRPHRNIPRRYL